MKKKLKNSLNSLSVLALLVLIVPQNIHPFVGNRHYPFYQPLEVGAMKGLDSNLSISTTNTIPVIEKDHGDSIQTPWRSYDLKNLNSTIQEYQALDGRVPVDYLKHSALDGIRHKELLFDMLLQRPTFSANLLATSYVFNDVFGFFLLPSGFRKRYGNTLNSNIDVFVKANLSVVKASSIGEYYVNEETKGNVVNLFKPDTVKIEQTLGLLEDARRAMHDELNSGSAYSRQDGISDLEFWVGIRKRMPYTLRCKNISLSLAMCGTLPTGTKERVDEALSFGFGREGGTAGAVLSADVELKHGLFTGASFEFNGGYRSSRERRVAMGKEPSVLSPLKAQIEVESASSFIFSPYIKLANFRNGFDIGLRFTYINHSEDTWRDHRVDATKPSFLKGPNLDSEIIARHNEQTAWTTKFTTLELSYSAGNRLKVWEAHPTFFASYEHPWLSKTTVRSKRLSAGMKFSF